MQLATMATRLFEAALLAPPSETRERVLAEVCRAMGASGGLWRRCRPWNGAHFSVHFHSLPPELVTSLLRNAEINPVWERCCEARSRASLLGDFGMGASATTFRRLVMATHPYADFAAVTVPEPVKAIGAEITVFRHAQGRSFGEASRVLLESLAPLAAAAATFASLVPKRPRSGVGTQPSAVVDASMRIVEAHASFVELMQSEYPDWYSAELPIQIPTDQDETTVELSHHTLRVFREADLFFVHAQRRSAIDQLSPKERQVADGVHRELSNKEIARELGVSPNTVANQLQSIYRKLDRRGRRELQELLKSINLG